MITITFLYRHGPQRCGCVAKSAMACFLERYRSEPERTALAAESGGCGCRVCHVETVDGEGAGDVGRVAA